MEIIIEAIEYSHKFSKMFKILGHPKRLELVRLLLDNDSLSVNELVNKVNIPQANVSQHLSKLRYEDIVDFDVQGTSSYYKLSNSDVKALLEFLETLKDEED